MFARTNVQHTRGSDPRRYEGQPPVAEKQPKTITVHGGSARRRLFLAAREDHPSDDLFARGGHVHRRGDETDCAVQDVLFKEMVGHIKEDDDSAPI